MVAFVKLFGKQALIAEEGFCMVNKVLLKIRKICFARYSTIGVCVLLVVGVYFVYPYYENHIMKVVDDTGWISSPDGRFQARLISRRRWSIHWTVDFVARSKVREADWAEIKHVRIFSLFNFHNWPDPIKLNWFDKETVLIKYRDGWDVLFPNTEARKTNFYKITIK